VVSGNQHFTPESSAAPDPEFVLISNKPSDLRFEPLLIYISENLRCGYQVAYRISMSSRVDGLKYEPRHSPDRGIMDAHPTRRSLSSYGSPSPGPKPQFRSSYDSPRPSFCSPAPSRSATGKSRRAAGRQITRNRASYSCHTCRRRKVKCDKVCAFVVVACLVVFSETC
jgi:hypothetical protein